MSGTRRRLLATVPVVLCAGLVLGYTPTTQAADRMVIAENFSATW
jgi:hypothetical protein